MDAHVAQGVRLLFDAGQGFWDLGPLADLRCERSGEARPRQVVRDGVRLPAMITPKTGYLRFSGRLRAVSEPCLRLALGLSEAVTVSGGSVAAVSQLVTLAGLDVARLTLPLGEVPVISAVVSSDGLTGYAPSIDYRIDSAGNGIARVVDSTIPDGAVVKVTYQWQAPDRRVASALGGGALAGAAVLTMTGNGPGLLWRLPRVLARFAGPIVFAADGWLDLPVELMALADESAVGFGSVEYWPAGGEG